MIKFVQKYIDSKRLHEFFGIKKDETIELQNLAQGEYNINFIIKHKSFGQLVFRINTASQMNLENQIKYEFDTLKLIENSNVTPKEIYLDDKKDIIPFGVLVMNYIEGVSLDYKKDLEKGAKCLAKIHNLNTEKGHLFDAKNPKNEIVLESQNLISKYENSNIAEKNITKFLYQILEKAEKIADNEFVSSYRTCINTEVNSGNFLIKEKCSLVDWEKAIYGDVAQDLGHFLAPTTTFWKTDIFLSGEEMKYFVDSYKSEAIFDVYNLEDRVKNYISMNCLRGVSWCAMAFAEYQKERAIKNEFTYNKIKQYVNEDFLQKIIKENL